MNHPAQDVDTTETGSDHPENTATLHVIDRRTLPAWTQSVVPTDPANSHCLMYLLPLGCPGSHSTRARRLRLKDSLAGGTPSHNAGILAKDPHFWDFLQQINLSAYDAEIDARRARHFINRVCNVTGRHELDRNRLARKRFLSLVEQPFLDWLFAAETT